MRAQLRLRTLEAFRAVYDTGSVTAASRRLGISQPAVSQAVSDFERAIGVSVFLRGATSRRLEPTAQGRDLYQPCCDALQAARDFGQRAARLGTGNGARITIGVVPAMATGVAQTAIATLRSRFPDARVVLDARVSREQETALLAGAIDLAIGTDAPALRGVEGRVLTTMPVLAAIPTGHRLAVPGPIDIAGLAGEPLALPRRPSRIRDVVDAAFRDAATTPTIVFEAPAFTLCAYAACGAGISVVTPIAAWRDQGGAVFRELVPRVDCVFYGLQRLASPLPSIGEALLAELGRACRQVLADFGLAPDAGGRSAARALGQPTTGQNESNAQP
ncbi:MAG: LysR family transcriptional regulator [Alphaproteobacteria bacterium]